MRSHICLNLPLQFARALLNIIETPPPRQRISSVDGSKKQQGEWEVQVDDSKRMSSRRRYGEVEFWLFIGHGHPGQIDFPCARASNS